MKSALKSPTKAESHRISWIKMHGCIACAKDGKHRYADAHHILDGGRRIGHDHTIPLCEWHHRGINLFDTLTDSQVEELLGPRLTSKRAFIDRYGTELELLAEIDDRYMESQIELN